MQIRKSICYVFFMSLQNATPYSHTAKFQRVRQEKKQKQFNWEEKKVLNVVIISRKKWKMLWMLPGWMAEFGISGAALIWGEGVVELFFPKGRDALYWFAFALPSSHATPVGLLFGLRPTGLTAARQIRNFSSPLLGKNNNSIRFFMGRRLVFMAKVLGKHFVRCHLRMCFYV